VSSYKEIFKDRLKVLNKLNNDSRLVHAYKIHYKTNPVDYINDWGVTYDPRKSGGDNPKLMPFILYPRQVEVIEWFSYLNEIQKNGAVDKSRDTGVTWCASAYAWWLFNNIPSFAVGFGSRKQDLVDRIGDPKSIFAKIRQMFQFTPTVLLPKDFNPKKHLVFLKCINPETGATIVGEAGDNIGRGARFGIAFKDESAFYEHPETVEASLGEATNVQIDISTHNSTNTLFYEAVNNYPPERVFTFDWRDIPWKTQSWYDEKKVEYSLKGLDHIFAQEVDRDPSASVDMVVIPKIWVEAAIDAHLKIKDVDFTGRVACGFDPKEEGSDMHANTICNGNIIIHSEKWGNGDSDDATNRTMINLTNYKVTRLLYDSVGIGSGVKNTIKNSQNPIKNKCEIIAYNGAESPVLPATIYIDGKTNRDMFANKKAQSWWHLRDMFKETYNVIVKGEPIKNRDLLISIAIANTANRNALMRELSQATYSANNRGQIVIDKKPDGAKSPNLADSCVMAKSQYLDTKIYGGRI